MKGPWFFFDKLEDRVRGRLSRYPIFYALIGGAGAVIFWRGVWHSADFLSAVWGAYLEPSSIDLSAFVWWDGPASLIVGLAILLLTGVFVSNFIGNEIIISGLKGEKKLTEKTERDVRHEVSAIAEIQKNMRALSKKLDTIEKKLTHD